MAQLNGNPPILNNPPTNYSEPYMLSLVNTLRIYLNQNSSNLGAVNTEANTSITLSWLHTGP